MSDNDESIQITDDAAETAAQDAADTSDSQERVEFSEAQQAVVDRLMGDVRRAERTKAAKRYAGLEALAEKLQSSDPSQWAESIKAEVRSLASGEIAQVKAELRAELERLQRCAGAACG